MRIGRVGATAAGVLVAVVLAGCGGDDDGDPQAADLDRYCELSAELERNAEQHFAQLGEGASGEDFEGAHVEFIDRNRAELDELPEVAPEEIRADVETILAGMRAQAGEEVDVSEAEVDAADERVVAFEEESC